MPFIDRAHVAVWNTVWRSAMRMDQWFGSTADETIYQQTSGSIAPALLWDEFDGLQPRLRFDVDMPLPHMNERLARVRRAREPRRIRDRAVAPAPAPSRSQYGPTRGRRDACLASATASPSRAAVSRPTPASASARRSIPS